MNYKRYKILAISDIHNIFLYLIIFCFKDVLHYGFRIRLQFKIRLTVADWPINRQTALL